MRSYGRQRQGEQHRGDGGVDLLVVLDLAVAEVEEGLPADVAPWRGIAAEQVVPVVLHRPVEVGLRRVEDKREERIGRRAAGVASTRREVGAVGRPDHRVAEPIGSTPELGQDAVVEQDVGAVQSADDDILIVARVAEQRGVAAVAIGRPGQILMHAAGADFQRRAHRSVGVGHVEIWPDAGAAAEDRVKIERGRARVRRRERVRRLTELRRLVEGDVVICELPDERRARGHRRVVGVGAVRVGARRVPVDRRVDNQALLAGGEVVARVHDAARHADFQQRARTVSVAGAKGGRSGKIRPNKPLPACAPGVWPW